MAPTQPDLFAQFRQKTMPKTLKVERIDAPGFSIPEAEAARDDGLETAELAPLEDWKAEAEMWVRRVPIGATVTADQLVAAVGLPRHDGRNNLVGAHMRSMAAAGLLKHTDQYARSQRVVRHASVQAIWERVG